MNTPADRDHVSQLLADLITNPRDPGYEAAAARHESAGGRRRWYEVPIVALCCAVIGFLLMVAYVHTHRSEPQVAKVRQNLIARVHAAEARGSVLASTARTLNGELNARRSSALSGASDLTSTLAREQLLAGQIAVTGPGLQVVLSEPPAPTPTADPGRAGTVPITATHILGDRDVRSVVNELWADGAEAISVNGVRLTPTSAIRFAGQAVLVDFQPIASPYTIRAIGPADQLDTGFASSPVASRYQTLAGVDGIGFEFTEQRTLSLPASPAAAPRYAHVPSARHTRGGR